MRNYYPNKSLPKNEQWLCQCKGKWRTEAALNTYVLKMNVARIPGHKQSSVIKHGTHYTLEEYYNERYQDSPRSQS